jgi:hypothetical protein
MCKWGYDTYAQVPEHGPIRRGCRGVPAGDRTMARGMQPPRARHPKLARRLMGRCRSTRCSARASACVRACTGMRKERSDLCLGAYSGTLAVGCAMAAYADDGPTASAIDHGSVGDVPAQRRRRSQQSRFRCLRACAVHRPGASIPCGRSALVFMFGFPSTSHCM